MITSKQTKFLIILFFVLLLITNLPFLPGPNFLNGPAQLLFTIGQFIGLAGLVGVPFGLVWVVIAKTKQQSLFRPLIFTIFFFTPLISMLLFTNWLRDMSRCIAIKNGNKLVQQIHNYKKQHGYYPGSIHHSTFKIPHSWIIGIDDYNYTQTTNNFELSFTQNVLLGFNFEIVTYSDQKKHTTQGSLKTLYKTCDKHWKYEVYD